LHPIRRTELNRNDTRSRIRAKKHGVMLNPSHDFTLPKSGSGSQPEQSETGCRAAKPIDLTVGASSSEVSGGQISWSP
jgi:hypothetical protein